MTTTSAAQDDFAIPHLIALQITNVVKTTASGVEVAWSDLATAISDVQMQTSTTGASLLTLTLSDHDWSLMTSGFLNVGEDGLLLPIDVQYPDGSGSWWRLCAVESTTDTSQANLTLTFEDRIVSELRDKWGAKQATRSPSMTRAEFIQSLVREVPEIHFVCPELTVQQPVASANSQTSQNLLPGQLTPGASPSWQQNPSKVPGASVGSGVTIAGGHPNADQINNVNTVLGVCTQLNVTTLVAQAILCAGIGESNFLTHNRNYLGADGVFQLLPSTAANTGLSPQDTAGTAKYWLQTGYYSKGGGIALGAKGESPGQIAVDVEGSGVDPSFYGKWIDEANALLKAYGWKGGSGGISSSASSGGQGQSYQFSRGTSANPDEDSWDCMNRLAQEVNWSLFSNANALYFMDGADLIAQRPALTISRNDDRVAKLEAHWDNSAFTYRATHKHKGKIQRRSALARANTPTEAKLDLICGIDDYRGGDVFVLQDCGAANGRWIVTDATRSSFAKYTEFTLSPPTAALPEPASDSGSSTSPGQPSTGGYVNPFGKVKGLTPQRIDMGVDYACTADSPIVALGNATVVLVRSPDPGWPGPLVGGVWSRGSALVYKLTDGQYKGKTIYVGENITPTVHQGQTVKAGDPVCTLHPQYPNCETGWANGDTDQPLAAVLGQAASGSDPGAYTTAAGVSFNNLLKSLGCPSGIAQSGGVKGTMPAGFP